MKRIALFMFLMVLVTSVNAEDRKIKGVTFPEQVTVGNVSCTFNGAGLRKKLIISVYVGGLYLEQPTSDSRTVIESEQAKRVIINVLYSEISSEQLVEAWDEGFEKNAPEAVETLKTQIDTFNSWFDQPLKKGEQIIVSYIPDTGTEVSIAGNVRGIIPGSDFMRAVFSIWFGPEPPSDDLKEGMLGE